MNNIKDLFEQKHQETLKDFGTAEREIDGTEVKIWNFNGPVAVVYNHESWAWPEIITVVDEDGNRLGAASLYPVQNKLWANVSADFNIPERLDFENGKSFYLSLPPLVRDTSGRFVIPFLILAPVETDDIWCLGTIDNTI